MLKVNAVKLSEEVFVAKSTLTSVTKDDVQVLKNYALNSPRGKCRLLLHHNSDDVLHEMVIVHTKGNYIRPHKNTTGDKSFRVLEGSFALVTFSDDGVITGHQVLSEYNDGGVFMVRISDIRYHTLINLTPQVVFIETCLGPFLESTYAHWAPDEGSLESIDYHRELCSLIGTTD